MSSREGNPCGFPHQEKEGEKAAMRNALAFDLLAVAGVAAAQIPPTDGFNAYTIPGVVNAPGQNNTRFVSDVALTNSGISDAFVIAGFVPANGLPQQIVPLRPARRLSGGTFSSGSGGHRASRVRS